MDSTLVNVSAGNSAADVKPEVVIKKQQSVKCKVKSLNKALQTFGPQSPAAIADAMHGIELPLDLEAYMNDFAIRSEERVLERMQHSAEFVQCASWSELLASKGFRGKCNNEIPLALRTIAYTEKFPELKNAKGVDFQLLYLNLACMMMGQPVRTMNAATQKLLKQVYEEAASEASRENQKEELALLQEKLKSVRRATHSDSTLDNTTNLELFFSDPNINPFQLPIESIRTKRS